MYSGFKNENIKPNFSFDIVSDYDKAELNNVFDQTQRELQSRYDFKGTPAAIEWLDDENCSTSR